MAFLMIFLIEIFEVWVWKLGNGLLGVHEKSLLPLLFCFLGKSMNKTPAYLFYVITLNLSFAIQ